MTKKKHQNTEINEKTSRCLRWLNISLGLGLIYAIGLIANIALGMIISEGALSPLTQTVMLLVWSLAKLGFALSLICLYQVTSHIRWALAGLLLALSALLPWFLTNPESQFLVLGIEALAITGLSLSLFDLGRATNSALELPSGLIFLGVVLQILQNEIMSFVGIVFLAFGFYLTLKKTWLQK